MSEVGNRNEHLPLNYNAVDVLLRVVARGFILQRAAVLVCEASQIRDRQSESEWTLVIWMFLSADMALFGIRVN